MALSRGNYFAAFPARVPQDVLDALWTDAPPALRWSHPEDLHLTLAFFGREDTSRFRAIHSILRKIPFEGAEVRLGSLLLLPKPRTFTALSFRLRGEGSAIANLIRDWRAPLLGAAKCPPDVRPALPHLTVVRPAPRDPEFDRDRIAAWAHALRIPPLPVQLLAPVLCGWAPDYEEAAALGLPKFRVIAT